MYFLSHHPNTRPRAFHGHYLWKQRPRGQETEFVGDFKKYDGIQECKLEMSCYFCNIGNPTGADECSCCSALIPNSTQREMVRLTRKSIAETSSIEYQPLVQLWLHKDDTKDDTFCTIGEFDVFDVKVLLIIKDNGEVNVSTSNASKLKIAADRSGRARLTEVTVLGAKKK